MTVGADTRSYNLEDNKFRSIRLLESRCLSLTLINIPKLMVNSLLTFNISIAVTQGFIIFFVRITLAYLGSGKSVSEESNIFLVSLYSQAFNLKLNCNN